MNMTSGISIEPDGSNDTGICECCGHSTRTVWGYAHANDCTLAAYFVQWTPGHISDHGANIDLIIGDWGEGTTAKQRYAVALAYRLLESGPGMMATDAGTRPVAESPLVGQALRREDVIGSDVVSQHCFAIADAVLDHDDRVAELLGGWTVKT